jgi:hypothetical protein
LRTTYQVADDDLAIAVGNSSFGGSSLCSSATVSPCGSLLNTTGRGGSSRAASSRASQRAAADRVAALGGDDLVKRLVELGRHDDEVW